MGAADNGTEASGASLKFASKQAFSASAPRESRSKKWRMYAATSSGAWEPASG